MYICMYVCMHGVYVEEVLMDSCEAIEDWIEEEDTDKVMNRVNAPK